MKQLYYITFTGRYILENERLSNKQISFSAKDTCTDFKEGDTVYHKRRPFRIDKVTYEKIDNYFR